MQEEKPIADHQNIEEYRLGKDGEGEELEGEEEEEELDNTPV